MCGGRRSTNVTVQQPKQERPILPAPPQAPVMPVQKNVAAPVLLKDEEGQGVRQKREKRERERLAIKQGTSSLRIPLNSGAQGTSGGLNV